MTIEKELQEILQQREPVEEKRFRFESLEMVKTGRRPKDYRRAFDGTFLSIKRVRDVCTMETGCGGLRTDYCLLADGAPSGH